VREKKNKNSRMKGWEKKSRRRKTPKPAHNIDAPQREGRDLGRTFLVSIIVGLKEVNSRSTNKRAEEEKS